MNYNINGNIFLGVKKKNKMMESCNSNNSTLLKIRNYNLYPPEENAVTVYRCLKRTENNKLAYFQL